MSKKDILFHLFLTCLLAQCFTLIMNHGEIKTEEQIMSGAIAIVIRYIFFLVTGFQ